MNLTNHEKFRLYCKHLQSPDAFIDFGFYFMISAALQRRVWVGAMHKPIYLNQYTILCGPPGVGKGLVINTIKEFLVYNKAFVQKGLEDASDLFFNSGKKAPSGRDIMTASPAQLTAGYSKEAGDINHKGPKQEPLLFPMASETLTFQAFVKSFMDSLAGSFYEDENGEPVPFFYCSLYMCLEELSSIFQQDEKKIIRMIVKMYDCQDVSYETLSRKQDLIKNVCFNFIAGTTPEFIQDTMDESLVGEGWNSRVWYIYETTNRFQTLLIPELTIEQKTAKAELLNHLRLLSKIKGQAKFTPQALDYLNTWWAEHPKTARVNPSGKLAHYYSRKQLHLMKLAAAIHFGEVTDIKDKLIGLNSVMKAKRMFDLTEKNMHLALSFRHKNPLADIAKKVETLLKDKGFMTFNEIFEQVIEHCRRHELEEVIGSLLTFKKIVSVDNEKKDKKGYRVV